MSSVGWQPATLGSIALAIKDGSHGSHKRVANGVPLLSAKNVAESGRLEWDDLDEQVSEEEYSAICRLFTPLENDLLLTIVGTLGRRALFNGARVAFQRSVAFVRADSRKVVPRYLYHAVGTHDFRQQLVRRSNATAQAGLYLNALGQTTIPLPPLGQQRAIAAGLDAADEAIAAAESVIAKLHKVRAGWLQDLLTRGLDENGAIRDPCTHPEQFQTSPLGAMPRDWRISRLENLCMYIGSGVTPRGGQDVYTSEGVTFIRSQNVTSEGLILEDVAFIPSEIHFLMRRSEVHEHDVLFNITGASIGRCCSVPEGIGTANVNQHVCILRVPGSTAPDALFLATLLASPIGQRQMEALNTMGNRQGLNYQQLGAFLIPWPEPAERSRIAQSIDALESSLRMQQHEAVKLRMVKAGLMADFLTGRVRAPENLKIEALA